jgi:uncharacterized delta-60 repeat protein
MICHNGKTCIIIGGIISIILFSACDISSQFVDLIQNKIDIDILEINGAAGIPDTTFNSTGYVVRDSSTEGIFWDDWGYGITVDANGKILVCGNRLNPIPPEREMVLWRYNSDGTSDTSFNSLGYVNYYEDVQNTGSDLAVDAEGKILVTGYKYNGTIWSMALWRYNGDGSLDTHFDTDGVVTHSDGFSDSGLDVTVDANGKILVAGYNYSSASVRNSAIWRYNSDGSPDTDFGVAGMVVYTGPNNIVHTYSLVLDADEKVLVSGSILNGSGGYDMVIWRYNGDGSPDTSFNSAISPGMVVYVGGTYSLYGNSIALDSMGRIVVAGHRYNGSNYDMYIWRYTSEGILDSTFGSDGTAAVNIGSDDYVNDLVIDKDGKILITGKSKNSVGNNDMGIWRFNSDGSQDSAFNDKGYLFHNNAAGGNGHDSGRSLTLDKFGRILVAGYSENGIDDDMVIWRFR